MGGGGAGRSKKQAGPQRLRARDRWNVEDPLSSTAKSQNASCEGTAYLRHHVSVIGMDRQEQVMLMYVKFGTQASCVEGRRLTWKRTMLQRSWPNCMGRIVLSCHKFVPTSVLVEFGFGENGAMCSIFTSCCCLCLEELELDALPWTFQLASRGETRRDE